MATKLFDSCTDSLSGVKEIFASNKYSNNNLLTFPLDVLLDDNKIKLNDDLLFQQIIPDFVDYDQEYIRKTEGKIYLKNVTIQFPKIHLETNKVLKEMFHKKLNTNLVFKLIDANNIEWIVGWDIPFKLIELDYETGMRNGSNLYTMSFISESYNPAYVTFI